MILKVGSFQPESFSDSMISYDFFKELQKKVEKKSINHRFSISPGIEVSFFFFLSVLTQFNPKLVLEIRRM